MKVVKTDELIQSLKSFIQAEEIAQSELNGSHILSAEISGYLRAITDIENVIKKLEIEVNDVKK